MIKKIAIAFGALCVLGGVAFAQTMDPGSDPVGFFAMVYSKLRSGEYLVAFGGALVAMVWLLRTMLAPRLAWLKTQLGGWVLSFGTAAALAVGTALMAGQMVTMGLMSMALTAALVASGGWEALKDVLCHLGDKTPVSTAKKKK